jgi:hypothetical protein
LLPSLVIALPVHAATPAKAPAPVVAPVDSDGDGLPDALELKFGTDPHNKDTDGDGFDDYSEIFNGWSPTTSQPIALQKSIHINLKTQTLEMRVMGITIQTFKISSGKASTPTPKGTFRILNKIPKAWSKMAGLWMPFWMAFDGRGRGLHELPIWPSGYREGAAHLGVPVSHGCVRLGIGPAKILYDWASIGTPVLID